MLEITEDDADFIVNWTQGKQMPITIRDANGNTHEVPDIGSITPDTIRQRFEEIERRLDKLEKESAQRGKGSDKTPTVLGKTYNFHFPHIVEKAKEWAREDPAYRSFEFSSDENGVRMVLWKGDHRAERALSAAEIAFAKFDVLQETLYGLMCSLDDSVLKVGRTSENKSEVAGKGDKERT